MCALWDSRHGQGKGYAGRVEWFRNAELYSTTVWRHQIVLWGPKVQSQLSISVVVGSRMIPSAT